MTRVAYTGPTFDAGSRLLSTETSSATNYLTADHLGSPRINTDGGGSVVARHDYMPFGEEISTSQRTSGVGYTADVVRTRFAGQPRDIELGLDFSEARMRSSQVGRFSTADPLLTSANPALAQSWNRYTYVMNNPLAYADPLGLFRWSLALGGSMTDEELRQEMQEIQDGSECYGRTAEEIQDILDGRQSFRDALSDLQSGTTDPNLTDDQRSELARSLAAYGNEGDGNGVTVTQGVMEPGVGASSVHTGYQRDADGNVIGATVTVTIGSHLRGQDIAMDVAHEGSHTADTQDAVRAWVRTGDYAQAQAAPSNVTKYETENRAYHVSADMAEHQGRSGLSFGNRPSFTIWQRSMGQVDQTALDGLLRARYNVTPDGSPGPGSRILP
ncbi:MAG: RHS repeat-associated core domain-containing protein [Acidobacteria bacterium]|nr:RHS repeat-associated core domain-containing protein [Acidobacteriota bacterium]